MVTAGTSLPYTSWQAASMGHWADAASPTKNYQTIQFRTYFTHLLDTNEWKHRWCWCLGAVHCVLLHTYTWIVQNTLTRLYSLPHALHTRSGLAHAHGGIIIRICLIKITSDMTSFADITSPLLSFIRSPFSLTLPVTSSTLNILLLSLTCSSSLSRLTLLITSSTQVTLWLTFISYTYFPGRLEHSHCHKEKKKTDS